MGPKSSREVVLLERFADAAALNRQRREVMAALIDDARRARSESAERRARVAAAAAERRARTYLGVHGL